MSKGIVGVFGLTVIAAACATNGAQSDDRRGHFAKSGMVMAACPAGVLTKRHPEMHFMIGEADGGGFSTTGATSDNMATALWVLTAKDSGSGSDVTLQKKGGSAAQLDEVWAAVEYCETGT